MEHEVAPAVGRRMAVALASAAGILGFSALALHSAPARGEQQLGVEPRRLSTSSFSCGGSLCGFLVLETGQGNGFYKHNESTVHGLWPQVPPYSDSSCIPPLSSTPNKQGWVPSCYQGGSYEKDPDHQASFVLHEFTTHGVCAGAASEEDYFQQICDLAAAPIAIMTDDIAKGGNVQTSAAKLQAAGYPVVEVNPMGQAQVMISACAKANGHLGSYSWQIASQDKFAALCGAAPSPPGPSPLAPADKCEPGERGPHCVADADCKGVSGCVRCAKSGFCTSEAGQDLLTV